MTQKELTKTLYVIIYCPESNLLKFLYKRLELPSILPVVFSLNIDHSNNLCIFSEGKSYKYLYYSGCAIEIL